MKWIPYLTYLAMLHCNTDTHSSTQGSLGGTVPVQYLDVLSHWVRLSAAARKKRENKKRDAAAASAA